MTELTPAEADAELHAALDLLDNGGRHCGCDPDLYGDSDFIGMVSDSHGRNHQEVRGAAIRALLTERDRLREALTELLATFPGAYYSGMRSQFMSRSQWIETARLDGWRALVARGADERTPHSEGP